MAGGLGLGLGLVGQGAPRPIGTSPSHGRAARLLVPWHGYELVGVGAMAWLSGHSYRCTADIARGAIRYWRIPRGGSELGHRCSCIGVFVHHAAESADDRMPEEPPRGGHGSGMRHIPNTARDVAPPLRRIQPCRRAELDDRRDEDETDCRLPSLLPKPLPPPLLPFLLLLPASREGGALGLRFSYVSRLSSRADSRPLARPTSTASAPRPCGGSWTGDGARKSPSVDHLRTRPLDPALMERLGEGPAWPCEGTSTGGGLAFLKVTLWRPGSDTLGRAAGDVAAFAAAEPLGDAFARALACSSRR